MNVTDDGNNVTVGDENVTDKNSHYNTTRYECVGGIGRYDIIHEAINELPADNELVDKLVLGILPTGLTHKFLLKVISRDRRSNIHCKFVLHISRTLGCTWNCFSHASCVDLKPSLSLSRMGILKTELRAEVYRYLFYITPIVMLLSVI